MVSMFLVEQEFVYCLVYIAWETFIIKQTGKRLTVSFIRKIIIYKWNYNSRYRAVFY